MKNFWRECSVVAALSIFSVYFYFLMEWIFFATKPSFMSSLAVPAKISALVIPPGLFSIAFICAIALLRLLAVDTVRALASNPRSPGMAATTHTNFDRLPISS